MGDRQMGRTQRVRQMALGSQNKNIADGAHAAREADRQMGLRDEIEEQAKLMVIYK